MSNDALNAIFAICNAVNSKTKAQVIDARDALINNLCDKTKPMRKGNQMSELKEYVCSFCEHGPIAKSYRVLAYNERQAKRIAKNRFKVDLVTMVETSTMPVILESKSIEKDGRND